MNQGDLFSGGDYWAACRPKTDEKLQISNGLWVAEKKGGQMPSQQGDGF